MMCYNVSSKQTKALLCLCFATISYPTQTHGEIQFFNIIAESGTVHYSGEYLENPGSVDLSTLTFMLNDADQYNQHLVGGDYVDDLPVDNDDDMTDEEDRKHSDTLQPTTKITVSPTNSPVALTNAPIAMTESPVVLTHGPVAAEPLLPDGSEPGSSEDTSESGSSERGVDPDSAATDSPTNSPAAEIVIPEDGSEPIIPEDTSEQGYFEDISESGSSEEGVHPDSAATDSPTDYPTDSPTDSPVAEIVIPEDGSEPVMTGDTSELGSSEEGVGPDSAVTAEPVIPEDGSEPGSSEIVLEQGASDGVEPSSEDGVQPSEEEGDATNSSFEYEDDYDYSDSSSHSEDEGDDTYYSEGEPTYYPTPSITSGTSGTSPPTSDNDDGYNRKLEGSPPGSYIDIIFFNEPKDCVNNKSGCSWINLGIGISDSDGDRYCCTEADEQRGICTEGRMIVDSDKFEGGKRIGEHRIVLVPNTGEIVQVVDPYLETKNGSGKYIMAIALCNYDGRGVEIDGQVTWKSKHGLLPAELYDEYCFSAVITAVYFILMLWYAWSMWTHRDSSIGIQMWIFGTIILGLIVMVLKVADFTLWNLNGIREQNVVYAWISFGGLEGSISRCLLVMVSLGWGVVRDTIGEQMKQIVFAGLIYAGLSFGVEAAAIYLEKDVQEISEDTEISPIKLVLSFAVAIMELVFYIWILDSLNGTMQYLENMNQSMKLKRYLRLRFILLISILFAMIVIVYTLVNSRFEGSVLGDGQEWATAAAWDANYMFILIAVAILWRPNPNAKQFAYVIELPTTGGGEDLTFDTHIDSPDNNGQGDQIAYRDVNNDHFKIDDTELS